MENKSEIKYPLIRPHMEQSDRERKGYKLDYHFRYTTYNFCK